MAEDIRNVPFGTRVKVLTCNMGVLKHIGREGIVRKALEPLYPVVDFGSKDNYDSCEARLVEVLTDKTKYSEKLTEEEKDIINQALNENYIKICNERDKMREKIITIKKKIGIR